MKYFIEPSFGSPDNTLMDFFKYRNKLNPEKGRLLISEPFLPDPNFERTVVLLCEHNEEGSFGFVLNKPAIVKVNDVMDELKNFEHPIFIGGPVQQDTLHFIHRSTEIEGGAEVREGIFWVGILRMFYFFPIVNNWRLNKSDSFWGIADGVQVNWMKNLRRIPGLCAIL